MEPKKTLYIARHAKSSWDFPGRADIDRPLAERGLNNAYEMARRMKERGDKPARMISSPANRALHTAIIYTRELKIPFEYLSVDENLYMAGEDAILQVIGMVDDAIGSIMVFGHNPDFTYLANHFVHSQIYNIPTSGIVRLEFDVSSWKDIHRGKLIGHLFDYPKKK